MASLLVQIASYLPGIKEPEKEQSLKEMLTWTGIVLLLYFTLGSINVYGGDVGSVQDALQQLQTFQTLLGAQIGSIITLGIGPIVTSSIVLQMMVGSELLPWDTNTQEGKRKFQSAQKVIAYALTFVQAIGYVLSGTFGAAAATNLGVGAMVAGQIALGGILIILMDDLVQKWGFGSGTGLFIAAGVSKQVFVTILSPLTGTVPPDLYWNVAGGEGANPTGAVFQFLQTYEFISLLPIISTILVFSAVVYMQTMKVEIPLTFGNARGFGQKWPLKFLYTSNMPVILVAALVSNLQIAATTIMGGNIEYLRAPTTFATNLITGGIGQIGLFGPNSLFHVFFYMSLYIFGSIMFSIFWVKTSGQDADSVAEQIQNTGMKVPGFRKDKRIIKKVLNRYIPGLTVLSGAAVGLLAAAANMTQAAGGGTGILLTVMILYKLYEQLAQKHMEELHPALKDFMQ